MRVFGSLPFRSSVVAKTRMFVEAASLIGLLVSFGLGTHLALFDGIGLFALWVAAMMSVWSALTYAGRLPDMPLHAFMPKRASR